MTVIRPRIGILACLLTAALGAWLWPGASQAIAPSGGHPTVSGTARQGSTLTLTQGTWDNTPTSVTDQWEDCGSGGSGCTPISGATGSSYTLTAADVGSTIEVFETATNADGPTTASSAPTAVVVPPVPVNTGAPAITGTARLSETLTASQGSWSNSPTSFAFQWERCTPGCSAISGATGSTYVLTSDDVGATIVVQVTATNAGGSSAPASSGPTSTVTAIAPVNSTLPAITGTAQQGQTLTGSNGTWSNAPASFTYQWERCTTTCAAISGATSATYLIAAADVGATIEVQVTAANTGGSTAAVSAATATVTPPPPVWTAAPSITGTPRQGSVLTEHRGTWTNAPTSFALQWTRCDSTGNTCAAIAGATAATYTPTAADVGATIKVLEVATNAGGSGSAFSALTATIATPANVVPVPTLVAAPALTGTAVQGQTLHESHGRWTFNPGSFHYQWMRCAGAACAAIPGATGQSYTLTGADAGQTIVVAETASNAGGTSSPGRSAHSGVVKATSKVSLVISPSAISTDQRATLVATISSSSGNVSPSGSITFLNGLTGIGGCVGEPVRSGGQTATITCQASFPAGSKRFVAAFQPAAGSLVLGSNSSALSFVVGRGSTSTSLQAPKRVRIGTKTRLVATVVSPVSSAGPFLPTGSIRFLDQGKPVTACKSLTLNHATATCTVKYASVGKHHISALYSGDSNFIGSASTAHTVSSLKKRSATQGFIGSYLQWKFFYHPTYTQVILLRATGVGQGMTLKLTCHGTSCPLGSTSIAVRASCPSNSRQPCSTNDSVNLLPAFHHKHLRVGAQIEVRITRPHWVGKYYSFTIVGGHPPKVGLACLAPGGRRPGAGC